jgi:RHS repeat-associated protein
MKISKQLLAYKFQGCFKKRRVRLTAKTILALILVITVFSASLPGFMGIRTASAEPLNLTGNWSGEAEVNSGPYAGNAFAGWMNLTQSGTSITGTFSSGPFTGTCSGTYSGGTLSLLGVAGGYRLHITATVTGTGQQIQGTWYDNIGDSGIYMASKAATSSSGIGAVSKIKGFYQWLKDFIAEPVDSATGAHYLERTMLTCYGTEELAFSIRYNSLLLNRGPLGNGWGHDYETRLTILTSGSIRVHWNANYSNLFDKAGGQYSSSDLPTKHDELVKNADNSYTLTRKDHSIYQFNSSGRLIQLQNGYGQSFNMTYDASGRLDMITEPVSGRFLDLHYNADNLVDTVSDNQNRQIFFGYDADHNLTAVTDASGYTTTYTYTAEGYVLSAVDHDGHTLFTNTYDSQGRVIAQQDGVSGHQQGTFSYDEASQPNHVITAYTDRNGHTRILVHDDDYNLVSETDELRQTSTYTYDADGNRTAATDPLNRTTAYTYDANGNLLTASDPAGNTTTYTYDGNNNLLTATNPAGKTTAYTYDDASHPNNYTSITDAMSHTTTYTYDSNGLLLTRTSPNLGTTSYTYQNGQPHTLTDPAGVTTTYSYDLAGRTTGITDAAGKTTTYSYDGSGNLLSRTDPLGNTISYAYDCRGNMLTATDARGNTTTCIYNGNNKLISITDPLNNTTAYDYDGEDRLIKITDPLGHETNMNYDAKGRLTGSTDANGNSSGISYDAVDNIAARTDGLDNTILTVTYDNLNNPLTQTDALNRTTTNTYDNLCRLTQTVDPAGHITQYHYDDLDRLIAVTDPANVQSTQGFDANGNHISLADANGNQTDFTYDSADRLTASTLESGSHVSCSYNSLGLLAQVTDARGQIASYQYDDAGRLSSLTDQTGVTTYTYDANGNVLTVSDSSGVITRAYDPLNRVTSYTDTQGNTIAYAYDQAGNLITLTYPGGREVHYAYDPGSRLTGVTDWAGRTTTYQYDQNNRLTATTRPDGSQLTLTYDDAGQLLQQKDTASGGSVISQYDYTYDNTGNPLTEQATPSTQPFSLTDTVCTYTNDNRVATYNSQTVTYDPDGNMTGGPLNGVMETFTYDARNRLTEAGTTTYSYDAENNRTGVSDSVSQTDDSYAINPQADLSQTLIKTDAQGNKTYYVYGLGLLGQEDPAGNYRSYHFDRRGSTIALTDQNGAATDTFQYAPYGELVNRTGSTDTPFLYNGQDGVMTDENGLYYMRARYYNPDIKRFINLDVLLGSIDEGQSLNRYAYVNGNPVLYTGTLIAAGGAGAIISGGALVAPGLAVSAGGLALSTAGATHAGVGYSNVKDAYKQFSKDSSGGSRDSSTFAKGAGNAGLIDSVKSGKTPVIGKMKDLETVGTKEIRVADYLPNKGDPKLNWQQNSSVLRQVMNEGKPIRDASPFSGKITNDFLGMERNLLQNHGWTYNNGFWLPPK